MAKQFSNKIALLCVVIAIFANNFKPSDAGNRYFIIVGLLFGIACGIYISNFIKKE